MGVSGPVHTFAEHASLVDHDGGVAEMWLLIGIWF